MEGAHACIPCPVAYIATGDRASECTACKAGTANPNTGQSECDDCSTGRFAKERASDCKACPFWEYADGIKCVTWQTCFALEAGIGLAYPSQCIATWIVILMAVAIPCLLCYIYKAYGSGALGSCCGGSGKQTIVVKMAAPQQTTAMIPLAKSSEVRNPALVS